MKEPRLESNTIVRLWAGIYFVIQGVAVAAWWVVLFLVPASRQYFVLERGSETSLMAFWLADLSFIGIGSVVAGVLCFMSSRYAPVISWFVTGAVSYAAIYCWVFTMMTDTGWLGVTLMFPAMIWSGVFAVGQSVDREMFRKAAETSTGWIVFKTLAQIVVAWSIILIVFPWLITIVEDKLGVARFEFPYQRPIAAVLFVAISSLGVYSAYVMAHIGKGTPLPMDHAKHLVIKGTYSYVRNPMAVSGIGQGLAVALFLGSPLVAGYALMGSLIWQLIFRPLEEDDLARRFGTEYDLYRHNVKCWIPRLSRYQIDGTAASSNSEVSPLGRM